jgi:hypothetical protein
MLVMSERGAEKLPASKFTVGAEGSVAAGRVGRTATAQTDAQMHADIVSGRGRKGCSRASRWREPPCAKIWMTTPRCRQETGEQRDRNEGRASTQGCREVARVAESVLRQGTQELVARGGLSRLGGSAKKEA